MAEDGTGQGQLLDLRDLPSRWPTLDGMVSAAPDAWRWRDNPDRLAVADSLYKDLLFAIGLELDGVAWPGRGDRPQASILGAMRDVARLWHLPSSEEPLPSPSRRRRVNHSRRKG